MTVLKIDKKRKREITWRTPDGKLPPNLPKPETWRVLILPLRAPEKTEGGLWLPDESRDAHDYLCFVGQIVDMGQLCYTNSRYGGLPRDRFPQVGDFVLYSKHVPVRVEMENGLKLVMMNDEHILATVPKPEGYRVYV